MEGATDREAKEVTRLTAEQTGISEPKSGLDHFEFRDVTGRLSAEDFSVIGNPVTHLGVAQGLGAETFLKGMCSYGCSVGSRYSTFLSEIGREEAEELHTLVVRAMISGSLTGLSIWLDQRHGPGAFAALFKAATYLDEDGE